MKIALAQIGARKNYVALRALATNQSLHSFSTDLYFGSAASKVIAELFRVGRLTAEYHAVTSRQASSIDMSLVKDFPIFALKNRMNVRRASKRGTKFQAFIQGGNRFSTLCSRQSLTGADGVYAFSSAALELFEKARQKGIKRILDFETPPAILESENVRKGTESFSKWLPTSWSGNPKCIQEYQERQLCEAELADMVICPSTYGRNLAVEAGVSPEKTVVVPFSMDSRFVLDTSNGKSRINPEKLNVLFLGNDAIRKGLPDMVDAISQLDGNKIDARGGGAWMLSDFGWAQCHEKLTWLGAVPRAKVIDWYKWADVFVLPTLSDAMGVVILEAMAAGVPVIATETSGAPDLIRDGIDGFVVPVNAPEKIAERLETLSQQPELLNQMSVKARERVNEFSFKAYKRNLLTVLHTAVSGNLQVLKDEPR